jgi:hypothetical protein
MITFNQDVLKGEANGSTFLQQVVLKPHEQAANVFIGATVKAVTSQVEYMLLNHSNEKVRPQTFRMKPKVLFRGKPATRWTYQQQTNA